MLSILLRNVVNKDLLEVVVENVYISTKGVWEGLFIQDGNFLNDFIG